MHVFECLSQLHRVSNIVMPVKINAELSLRTKFFPNNLHVLHNVIDIGAFQVAKVTIMTRLLVRWIEHARDRVALKLESSPPPTFSSSVSHQFAPGLRVARSLFGNLSRAIESHPIPKFAAKQIASWRVQDAPSQIPECDLDSTCGGDGGPADRARSCALHEHLGIELVDVERIFPYNDASHLVHDEILHAPSPIGLP